MNIKKQAANDATVLFAINAEFWKTWDASRALASENPKYDEIFTNTYNALSKKFVGKEDSYNRFVETVVKKRRSRKPTLIGLAIIGVGILHGTGYDAVLLEKGKQRFRRARLVTTDFVNKGETYDKFIDGTAEKVKNFVDGPDTEPKHAGPIAPGDGSLA